MIRSVSFPGSRGRRLVGSLHVPEVDRAPGTVVVLCHGMESSRSGPKHVWLSGELERHGLTTLRFDFAGCGESEGAFEDMTYSSEAEDLRGALAFLADEGFEAVRMFGSSMGGGVAFLVAGASPSPAPRIVSLVTLAAVGHPGRASKHFLPPERLAEWHRTGVLELSEGRRVKLTLLEDARALDIVHSAAGVACPTLLIHGSADDVVPVQDVHDLHDAIPHDDKRLVLVPGADHRISDERQMADVLATIVEWLETDPGELPG